MNQIKKPSRVTIWGIFFYLLLGYSVILLYTLLNNPPDQNSIPGKLTAGFVGNVTSSIWVGVLLLFLTLHLGSRSERNLSYIKDVVEAGDARREVQTKIERFDRFMRDETYHDFILPSIKQEHRFYKLGLIYTIESVKDGNDKPKRKVTEMNSLYVVKVREPANIEVLSKDDLKAYENSPIKEGEYYYAYFNGVHWCISEEGNYGGYPIRFWAKQGPVEHGESANAFMGLRNIPTGYQQVAQFIVKLDGNLHSPLDRDGGRMWYLLKDENGRAWIKDDDSPVKEISLKPRGNTWFFDIDELRGYYTGEALLNFRNVVQRKCEEQRLNVPRNPVS